MKILKHPYEYFAAQVLFASKMSEMLGMPLPESLIEYTDLYCTYVQKNWEKPEDDGDYSPIWLAFMKKIKSISDTKEITKILFNEYSKIKNSYIEVTLPARPVHYETEETIGCFTINYDKENREKNQIRLHFAPLRTGIFEVEKNRQVSDLSTLFQKERREEFKAIAKFIKDNLSQDNDFKYLLSSTWLQNIPNYQRLFPKKYLLPENRILINDNYLGLWGQFERWDRTGNRETLSQFETNLRNTKNELEVRNSFPYPIYEIKVSIQELFEYYSV